MALSLSILRRNRNWRGLNHQLDPDVLPCTIDLAPPRWALWVLVGFGLVWLSFASSALGDVSGWFTPFTPLTPVVLLFPAIGLLLVGFALLALYERRRATFGLDGVTVEGRSLDGREHWSLPYTAYRGVLHRTHVVRRKNGSTTYQIIELLHDDLDKTLPLSVEAGIDPPRARWEGYARAFGLPALEQAGGRLIGREAADLDKSLQELAAEGKVAQGFDPTAPAPPGLQVAHEAGKDQIGGERLRVTVTAGRVPLWMLILFSVLPAIVFAAALWVADSPTAAAIPLLFLVAVALVYTFDRRHPRQLVITRKTVTLIDAWQGTGPNGKTLKSDQIETVTVQAAGSKVAGRLVIAGDKGSLRLGSGLSRPALDWLADYVTAAISTA